MSTTTTEGGIAITAQQLYERLAEIPAEDREHAEVRIVFHGYRKMSLNQPALRTSGPGVGVGFNIVAEEER